MKPVTRFEEFVGPCGFRMGRGTILVQDRDGVLLMAEDGTKYLVRPYGVFTMVAETVLPRRGISIPM